MWYSIRASQIQNSTPSKNLASKTVKTLSNLVPNSMPNFNNVILGAVFGNFENCHIIQVI